MWLILESIKLGEVIQRKRKGIKVIPLILWIKRNFVGEDQIPKEQENWPSVGRLSSLGVGRDKIRKKTLGQW